MRRRRYYRNRRSSKFGYGVAAGAGIAILALVALAWVEPDNLILDAVPIIAPTAHDGKIEIKYPTNQLDLEQVEFWVGLKTSAERGSIKNGFDGINVVFENDPDLNGIARAHSIDMANRNYYSHDTPEGLSPTDRGKLAGYDCQKDYGTYYTYGLAENLYKLNSFRGDEANLAEMLVAGWMESEDHRANIMNPDYSKLGVGVHMTDSGVVYATQLFC